MPPKKTANYKVLITLTIITALCIVIFLVWWFKYHKNSAPFVNKYSAPFVHKNSNDIIISSEGRGDWGRKVVEFLVTSAYPMKNVRFINASNCDVIVRSVFITEEGNWNSKSKKYIYYSGETNTPGYTKNLSRENHLHSDILKLFTHKADNALWVPFVLLSKWLYKDRPKDCNMNRPYLLAYCNSNCVPFREEIFDVFVKLTSTDQCHALSMCHGSYENSKRKIQETDNRVDHQMNWNGDELTETYKNYRFVIAMENCVQPGYVTEKILNAFAAGSIPIYHGAPEISELFNPKAFINLSNFKSTQEGVEYVINMTHEQCNAMQQEPIYNEENDVINLFNTERTLKRGNKVLEHYVDSMRSFLNL